MTSFQTFQLKPLPYEQKALEPHISAQTLELHYGKHHRTYLDNLNKLLVAEENSDLVMSISENLKHPYHITQDGMISVIRSSYQKNQAVFNNAAQVWNHTFYWESMKQNGGAKPESELLDLINQSYGNYENFCTVFHDVAVSQFGSGWAWLVKDSRTGKLDIIKTGNADTPVVEDTSIPLITCDVWEHAYYVDYQNLRSKYVKTFLSSLVNWDFAWQNYQNS